MMNIPQDSLLNPSRITPAEEQAIISHIAAASLIAPQNVQNVEIRRQAGDISDLKEQLEQKDAEIADLRKKVKDLEHKNNNLVIKLEEKDEEVNALKKRIQTLEDEKKTLQEELAFVQYKQKTLEEDVKMLKNSRDSAEKKSSRQDGELKKMQYRLEKLEDDLATSKTENETLKKQVRHQSRYVPGAPLLLPVPASEDKTAMVHLGEMCCQIQDKMYKKILPEHFTPIRNNKVKSLLRDIEKLSQSEDEKTQALKRWEDLKNFLKWNEDLEEALDALQDTYSRNIDTNPPKLSENDLKDSAKCLAKQGILKGWLAMERVNNLIDVWKRLVLCGENA